VVLLVEAVATCEGPLCWAISFPDFETATRTTDVVHVARVASDHIAAWLGADVATIDVHVTYQFKVPSRRPGPAGTRGASGSVPKNQRIDPTWRARSWAAARARGEQVLAWRAEGVAWVVIADRLGVQPNAAQAMGQRAKRRAQSNT
jgi:hypothetical protein